ncbi:hypothetical protein [Lederbergia panacisoli]|uniref:hypothetical protein n=1 Tax=Lederbergia panacisoli TaxID=1255251 RepID=UPI00214C034B|nr:hypothetical protein [Lederbergia panacisoli]MCR2820605.1 hypothetical protein [Lederbergia panacisoli]
MAVRLNFNFYVEGDELEKTYFVVTLIFGSFISLSLAVFTYYAFKLGYSIIGVTIALIFLASAAMNIAMFRKWKK